MDPKTPLQGANESHSAQVWVATDDLRIIFYAASDPERGCELGRIVLPSQPISLVYHCGQVRSHKPHS